MVLMTTMTIDAATVGRSVKGSEPLGNRLNQVECFARIVNGTPSTEPVRRQGRRIGDKDDKALEQLFAGEMRFSVDFFKAIYDGSAPTESLVMSPMSVYSALMLTYFGANGQTEEQIGNLLGFHNTTKVGTVQAYKLVKFARQLMRFAKLVDYDFEMANRVFFDKGESVRDCMREILAEDLELVDFADNALAARQHINTWVEGLTQGKIRDLATPDLINPQTRMAIVNAAYFKGKWATQFQASSTKPMPFHVRSDLTVNVDMMFQKGTFRHALSEEMQAHLLQIPFSSDDVSFYIILPAEETGTLEQTISRLSIESLRQAMDDTFPVTFNVGLPKFQLEKTAALESVLASMGVRDLFDASRSDLSTFNGIGGLSVDAATHKAFIDINEDGAEAAAATAMVSLRMARPIDATEIICDRPFIFFIHDNLSDSILFMGAYRGPRQ